MPYSQDAQRCMQDTVVIAKLVSTLFEGSDGDWLNYVNMAPGLATLVCPLFFPN